MSENVEQNGCPSFEVISAHLDGEAETEDATHIESCPHCLSILASLRALDQVVVRASQPSQGLSSRILAACAADRDLGPATVTPFWGRSLLRYAAALAITVGLAFAVRQSVGNSSPARNSGQPVVVQDGEGTPTNLDSPQIGPNTSRAVSTQTGGDSAPTAAAPVAKRLVAIQVRHVWGVTNLDKVEKDVASQLPEGTKWGVTRDNAGILVEASLTDEQLQKLVTAVHAQGYNLFSSELPQPSQEDRVKFMGGSRKVIYEARFVSTSEQ